MDSAIIDNYITDTIMKSLAYCAVNSSGKFADNCQEVWQRLADISESYCAADRREANNVKL